MIKKKNKKIITKGRPLFTNYKKKKKNHHNVHITVKTILGLPAF